MATSATTCTMARVPSASSQQVDYQTIALEFQHTWRTASSMIGDRSLIVDLSYVTGVDAAGQKLLRRWHDQGAQLVAKSLEARVLIQSITGQAAGELSATARHSTWLPFQRVVRWALRS